jgi:hypothetical protein
MGFESFQDAFNPPGNSNMGNDYDATVKGHVRHTNV